MDRVNRAAVALGSNVGDRGGHLAYAVSRLADYFTSLKVSRSVATAPVNVPGDQPDFLNAAVVGETTLAPRALLDTLLAIERERGRERPFPGAARTLDLDLILFADRIINEPGLLVPHPRFRERRFVLAPLAEIAPDLVDPVTGQTVEELLGTWGRGTEKRQ